MTAKAFRNKVVSYGPGGYKCPCCGPNPKHRDEERRRGRRIFSRFIEEAEKDEGLDIWMFEEFDRSDAAEAIQWWHEWLDSQS